MTGSKQGLLDLPRGYLESMKTRPGYKWFKPILAALVSAVVYVVLVGAIYGVSVVFGIPMDGQGVVDDAYMGIDMTDPLQVIFSALSIAVMIPAVGIGVKITRLGGLKGLSSARGGLRWGLIAKIALPLFILTAVLIVIENVARLALEGRIDGLTNPTVSPLALIAILIFFPLQCAGEEFMFRGLLSQALGSWMPIPAVVIILQGVVFACSHGYDLATNISIAINGVLWGWITLKTGGLEASICLHAANNVAIFLMNSVFACTSVTVSNPLWVVLADIAIMAVTTMFAYFLCKKSGY